jgi:O-antigen/teichoic acid export membrane protein
MVAPDSICGCNYMNNSTGHAGRHMLDGTLRVFVAEALILPTGLLTVIFLTRRLGPDGYGLFTLSAAIVTWIETGISALFSRASIKFISETPDWGPVGTTVLRLYLAASCIAGLILFFMAGPAADLLNAPFLRDALRLFAIDIPLFCLSRAYRNILTGFGKYRQRAVVGMGRWLSRLALIILLVEIGFSVSGAIMGSIGASLLELCISRLYIQPSLSNPSPFPVKKLMTYALPLSLFALSTLFLNKIDLVLLKILGGTISQAGIYAAAVNLAVVPGIFSLSFSPLLLSTLGHLLASGQEDAARKLGRDSLRGVLWLLPFAGMTAGAASEIVVAIFGKAYFSGAPLLALLIFSALAWLIISVCTAILTACGKPHWPVLLIAPVVPLAFVGHLLLIPRLGPLGASMVTTFTSLTGALAALWAVFRVWRIFPPAVTFLRSLLICGLAFLIAQFWPASSLFLLIKIPAIMLAIIVSFLISGELSRDEFAFAKSLMTLGKRSVEDRNQ